MPTYQYVTTSGRYGKNGVSDPVRPEGELSWELVGSSAADGLLFWFWRAEKRADTLPPRLLTEEG